MRKPRTPTKGKPWTDAERSKLRQMWGKRYAHEIASYFGRSRQSITGQAHKMGLANIRGLKYEAAKGSYRANHHVVINVYFDTETFEQVRDLAVSERLSFSRKVLDLVEWGLMEEKRPA